MPVQHIRNFLKYRFLLQELVARDIKLKYRRSVLGILWSLLNPLITMTVISIVFSQLFRFDVPNYHIYVLTGLVMFSFFSDATSTAMNAILINSALIKKVYIPKYILVFSKSISAMVNFIFAIIAIFIILLFSDVKFNLVNLLFPLPMVYIFIFASGIGLILSVYTVFYRDLAHLYIVGLTAWMYLTPIIYPIEIVPERFLFIVKTYNPLYYFLLCFREIVFYSRLPSLELHITCLGLAFVALIIGIYIFINNQDRFIMHI
jgi:ABC-2 type transport system permease protein